MALALVPSPAQAEREAWQPGTIEVRTLTDSAFRKWSRMPEEWRANAPLCEQVDVYDFGPATYRASCKERSLWTDGLHGLCGRHFFRHLEVGQ